MFIDFRDKVAQTKPVLDLSTIWALGEEGGVRKAKKKQSKNRLPREQVLMKQLSRCLNLR